ncbi:LysR family transcriptional regulator [Ovoidimarina sediminis]|uniref:LysR family transcriptional regulator n=1 Tax=Ovoidimarina sediminis TaxID=3079856 RepID=UPI002907BA92|nr:LysR family transcriptional regulator [Rhodophyticola sp. MJ-SS7]MDU8945416.1 LysR family transcriptional regulator [Rhodophyticola sp. MJ-SS7]
MKLSPYDLNLRHLCAFVEVCRAGSISGASAAVHLSQPAITHALHGLEARIGSPLFHRGGRGMQPTQLGQRLRDRAQRALDHLNSNGPRPRSGRLETNATGAQLRVLEAIGRAGSISAAARSLNIAQPSAHRAARTLEERLRTKLFEKSRSGMVLTRQGYALSRAARLMWAELDQGLQEIATAAGSGSPRMRIGALPLARATIIGQAIDRVQATGPGMRVLIDDGPFPDLLRAVRAGELDILVGALRNPPPAADITQEVLFSDGLGIFCGPGHPLLRVRAELKGRMHAFPWVLPRRNTPTREYFEAAFPDLAGAASARLIETSSMILVRELLQSGERLTLMSRTQAAAEVRRGTLFELPVALADAPRPIGLLYRSGWVPTSGQGHFLNALREVSAALPG